MGRLYLGIDPSLTSTGVVLIRENGTCLKSWNIKATKHVTLPEKLVSITNQLTQVPEYITNTGVTVGGRPIKCVAIETPFVGNNKLVAHVLSAVWGAITSTVMKWRPESFIELHPTVLKQFVAGKHQADKQLMVLSVYKLWKFEDPCVDIVEAFALAHIARCLDNPSEYSAAQRDHVRDHLRLKNAGLGAEND